jgi:hypothetical protein
MPSVGFLKAWPSRRMGSISSFSVIRIASFGFFRLIEAVPRIPANAFECLECHRRCGLLASHPMFLPNDQPHRAKLLMNNPATVSGLLPGERVRGNHANRQLAYRTISGLGKPGESYGGYVFSVAQPSRLRVKWASSPNSQVWRRDVARTRRRGRLRYSCQRSSLTIRRNQICNKCAEFFRQLWASLLVGLRSKTSLYTYGRGPPAFRGKYQDPVRHRPPSPFFDRSRPLRPGGSVAYKPLSDDVYDRAAVRNCFASWTESTKMCTT